MRRCLSGFGNLLGSPAFFIGTSASRLRGGVSPLHLHPAGAAAAHGCKPQSQPSYIFRRVSQQQIKIDAAHERPGMSMV